MSIYYGLWDNRLLFKGDSGSKVGTSPGTLCRAAVWVGMCCLLQDFASWELSGGGGWGGGVRIFIVTMNWRSPGADR